MGLPFAFASHFAPDAMDEALALYRRDFRPSHRLQKPHAMLGVNIVAAGSDAEAKRLFTTQQQSFINLRRGRPGLIPPPIDDIESYWTPTEKFGVERALACAVIGDATTVKQGIEAFVERHRPDELMVTANVFDHEARCRSFAIVADVREKLLAEG